LRAIAALALLAAPLPTRAQNTSESIARWQPLMAEAAARFSIPESWIARVMHAESAGLTTLNGRPIRSHAGAMGLMQLMPTTWAAMRERLGLGANPDDPRDNIMAGAAYLRLMYDRFGYPGMFAAYNAGPGRYAAYLAGQSTLPRVTLAYLAGVTGGGEIATVAISAPPRQLLFALRHDLGDTPSPAPESAPPEALFAVRKDRP
jgi:soluble lytic murein transglycosylase-like protein